MNKTNIDWPWKPLYTWNPVVGCKHGCVYCYAKRISDRFTMIPKWEEPQFLRDRLMEPTRSFIKKNIFVCSMADLFGEWVPSNWIQQIIDVIKYCDIHTFYFLTKNPGRYAEFEFPGNCWKGATITNRTDLSKMYYNLNCTLDFLSIEPLLGSFQGIEFIGWKKLIVGAMTGHAAIKPKQEWIDSIKHPNIYYKNSINQRSK